METPDQQLSDIARIDTGLLNRYFHQAYTDASNLYDQAFENLGKVEILNTGLRLIDTSNKRIILQNSLREKKTYNLTITPTSKFVYPSSISDNEKAEPLPEFGIIVSKIINKRRIFTDLADMQRVIRPGVTIRKSSHNYIFLSKPEAVFESDINDILVGEYPYLLRFIGKDVTEANLILETSLSNELAAFNTLEYHPFPAGGLMELDSVSINDSNISNKISQIEFNETTALDRTFPAYIPFVPIQGNRLNISLTNRSRIESLNGSIVGVDLLEAFSTTYASTSYFGYSFSVPDNTKLTGIEVNGTWYSPKLSGVSIRVYDKQEEFDKVSNKYITGIDEVLKGTTNLEANKIYWLLFILNSNDNFPQTISSVGVNFG